MELELKVKELLWEKQKDPQNLQIDYILTLVPDKFLSRWRKNVPDLGKNNIVKLHQEIKELLLEVTRLESRWDTLLHQTFILEDIIASFNSNTSDCVIESTLFPNSRFQLLNKLYWIWYCKIKRYFVPAISILLSLFAVLIIIA
jgi:hypothetical protein